MIYGDMISIDTSQVFVVDSLLYEQFVSITFLITLQKQPDGIFFLC